jgi:glycosyltransferase involved in cell wall biosynthesis
LPRILHISTRLILGGSQENTVLSCEGQSRLGHDVHLAFGPIYGPEGSLLDRVRVFRTSGGRSITTHIVPHMLREVRPLADARAYRELRALIASLRPDVVHTHSSKAGILGRAAAWSLRRELPALRVVHTIHGPPFMPVEGGVLARARTRATNAIYTLAERFAARRCHAIVSVADAMTREFLRRGIGRGDQYTTVRSGMEVGPFLHAEPGEDRASVRARLGLALGDFVVGTVARLAQHKGHDDLLDALADEVRRETKAPRLVLLWVGDGWWRERLIAKARNLGLRVRELDWEQRSAGTVAASAPADADAPDAAHPHIVVTGMVPPERVAGLVRAMDVLAHPSSREGLPRTVPQALLAGVCPVAYDADGTREACVEMATGRLVRVGDVAGLRDAILWCRDHPRERQALASAGKERCAREFSAEAMVAALERVYWSERSGEL